MTHRIDFRVYFEDTDAGGIVYHSNYFNFCERGRTEYLRTLGFENSSLKKEEELFFVVHAIEAKFKSPARLDDIVTVETGIVLVKNVRFDMKQSIYCRNNLIFLMKVGLACVTEDAKPIAIPEKIRNAFIVDMETQIA